jgi:CDP-paratose synthetase
MKILITGITGFIGSNLYKELNKNGHTLYSIIRNESDLTRLNKDGVTCCLYNNFNDLNAFFLENEFDGIIHLASKFIVNHNSQDLNDLINSNVLFSTQILELACKNNVKWFINTGTFWQHYNNSDYLPVNLYSATKQAFESIAKFYTDVYDIKFVSLKINDTYGPNDTRSKIFNLWLKISQTNDVLDMSPGEQLIDIVYIDDVVQAYIELILLISNPQSELNNSYYISSKNIMSLKKLSEIFENVINKKLNINWGARDYRNREVMVPAIKGELVPNWEPKVKFNEGINKILEKAKEINI